MSSAFDTASLKLTEFCKKVGGEMKDSGFKHRRYCSLSGGDIGITITELPSGMDIDINAKKLGMLFSVAEIPEVLEADSSRGIYMLEARDHRGKSWHISCSKNDCMVGHDMEVERLY